MAMTDDFEKQLEDVAERAISADGRSSDNTRQINALKIAFDGHQIGLDKIEEKLATDKAAIEALRSALADHQAINQEQHNAIADLNRRLSVAVDRLDGKNQLQVEPYERVVATVREHSETLRGGEGQLSFSQLRNSIQQTQFLGQVIKAMIGLFGVGSVTAAGFALFGKNGISPEVQALQIRVTEIRSDIDRLQSRWEQDIRDRLSEGKK